MVERSKVMVSAPGGRMITRYRQEIVTVTPLIEADVFTGSADCEVTPDCKREAITLAFAIDPNPLVHEVRAVMNAAPASRRHRPSPRRATSTGG